MAKLNVDEIEANGTNSNVKVVAKGTDGSCEIKAATNDATLQLNCSAQTHGVKLKTPDNTAGQNYTMILPDNQIAANKLLKVKSVSGTGVSAVGQLEYADAPSSDISSTSLNADNITSGSLPAARFPTFAGSTGAALEKVSEQTVGSTDVSEIIITGFEDDTMYKLVVPQLKRSSSGSNYINWLDSSNTNINSLQQERFYWQNSSYPDRGLSSTSYQIGTDTCASLGFVADISNKAGNMWMIMHGFGHDQTFYGKVENYVTSSNNTDRIYGLRFHPNSSSAYYIEGSKVILYKYKES
jgi:hypothetical protein